MIHNLVHSRFCFYPFLLIRNKESQQDYESLKNYLANPNPDCDLIFLVNTSDSDLDKKNEINQLIEKNGQVVALTEPKQEQWNDVVKHYFSEKWSDTVIDSDAVNELARRTEGDYASLFNNGSKLALYTNHITFSDVTMMVTRPLEENAFMLFNYLVDERNMDAVALFRDLKSNNVEPVTLISMIANQFRLLNRVSYLARHSYGPDDIAKELSINPIRAKILRKNSFVISGKRILKTLEDLYQLDWQIKSGLVDRYYSFELFLINFKRK